MRGENVWMENNIFNFVLCTCLVQAIFATCVLLFS